MRAIVVALLHASAVIGCTVGVTDHDPDSAARTALAFATATFVGDDVDGAAYYSLSDAVKNTTPIERYREIVSAMHPRARPRVITATEFEPIPGQESMNIFLHGKRGEEHFYYRLLMEGTARHGYRVAGLWRGTGPYPPSKTRQSFHAAGDASNPRP